MGLPAARGGAGPAPVRAPHIPPARGDGRGSPAETFGDGGARARVADSLPPRDGADTRRP